MWLHTLTFALLPAMFSGPLTAQSAAPSASINDVSRLTFVLEPAGRRPPVQIAHIFVGDREIPLDSPVTLYGNWLKDFHAEVRNTSPRHIVYANLTLLFPEAGNIAQGMTIGRYPERALMQRDGTIRTLQARDAQQPADVPPGESVIVTPGEGADQAQSAIYAKAFSITRVVLSFNSVYFADDTKWGGGQFAIAVPPPKLWQQLSDEAFYGIPGSAEASPPPSSAPASSDYAARREAALAPANLAMAQKNYAQALADCREVLLTFPDDGRVLYLAANAAWVSGQLEDAASYFRDIVRQEASARNLHAWGSDLTLLRLDAQLGHWQDFARMRAVVEKAGSAGDRYLPRVLTDGFAMDSFTVGPQPVTVLDFPIPAQAANVRLSFRLFGRQSEKVLISRVDLLQQPGHPGDFVLKQYAAEPDGVIIASYTGGEPAYQDIRARVLQILEGQLGTTSVTYPVPHLAGL